MVFKNKVEAASNQPSKKHLAKLGSLSKHYLSGISHMANDHKAVGSAHHQPIAARLLKRRKELQSYGRMGSLEVRLANRKKEIKKAQRLRYKVFYKEMSAIPDIQTKMKRRDIDVYDKICDHLLVLDHEYKTKKYPFSSKSKIVATYRILTEEMAQLAGGFYTQDEFDIEPLLKRHRSTHKFLELGRSCVLKPYRSKRSVELLWRGLWAYIQAHKANAIIGCASFEGVDPKEHALALSFLHHHAAAPDEWKVKAHANRYVNMNMIPKEEIDMKAALKALPPLIKGYLRLGAYIGEGAVIDNQFGTTDVMIIMPTENISERYINHFSLPEEKTANLSSTYLN
jgi:putative hemolysin